MSIVESYGLHWDGSVAWLLQGRKGSNFIGMKATCPFQVEAKMCNHLIPAAAPIPDRIQWELFSSIFQDVLTQTMLPLPVENNSKSVVYYDDPYDDLGLYLSLLSRMSSPIRPVVKPMWTLQVKDLEKLMTESNIQPLVLVQADQKSQKVIDAIGHLAMYTPRRVVITGKPEVVLRPPINRLESRIREFDLTEITPLPLESIGAMLLRRFARREPLDAPVEQRVDRRSRLIQERTNK